MIFHPSFSILPTPPRFPTIHEPHTSPVPDETGCVIVLADTARDAAWVREDFSVLTEQETNYAKELEPQAAATWVAGRVVLRHELGAVLDRGPESIEIRLDSAGKPRVDDCEFSVTRAQRLVLVAVAGDPIGIDLEAVPSREVALEATTILHPREREELESTADSDLAEIFVRVWARKEAFLKALSTGLARDPGMDYIGAPAVPASPHPDIEIFDLEAGIPSGYHASIAVNR